MNILFRLTCNKTYSSGIKRKVSRFQPPAPINQTSEVLSHKYEIKKRQISLDVKKHVCVCVSVCGTDDDGHLL